MAIVKMKRLRLLGLRADREQLLRPLQQLCAGVSESIFSHNGILL